MLKRLVAILFIFSCVSIAWFVLSGTIYSRTYTADSRLKSKVERIWGTPQIQSAPDARFETFRIVEDESIEDGKKIIRKRKQKYAQSIPLVASEIAADLKLEHRQKGLLWYATYIVDFGAVYEFHNDSGAKRLITLSFPFSSQQNNFDRFLFQLTNADWHKRPKPTGNAIEGSAWLSSGEKLILKVSYRTQGLDNWTYQFGNGVSEIKDFRLAMTTDFHDIDFPDSAMSPTQKNKTDSGWELTWQYDNMISGVTIGMRLPQKLQPGPLAGQISMFAPVSLFFFIIVLLAISIIQKINLHPMHFFFLASAFFAFHLLLAYLVDHISIHLAFVIASVVSLALVISYLRVTIGNRFAFVQAGSAQLIYLVLFSYAFFFKGFTGLAVTIGAIVTLFVLMQMTAKIDWFQTFRRPS